MEQEILFLEENTQQCFADVRIPPCPAILTKLIQETRTDEPDFSKISKLIGSDASLGAAMLQTVNSPFYGLRRQATSVQQATALLGLRSVVQIITGLLLRGVFSGGSNELMDEYWESSSAIAEITAFLARHMKVFDHDEAYTMALFRDCGMLAMMNGYRDYKPLFPGANLRGDDIVTSLETGRHHMNHAQVGYRLAKTWLLPEQICQSVLLHHDYAALQEGKTGLPAAVAGYIALALVAEWIYVTHIMGMDSREWRLGGEFALGCLNISSADLNSVAAQVREESGIF